MFCSRFFIFIVLASIASQAPAVTRTWTIDGVQREAIIHPPSVARPAKAPKTAPLAVSKPEPVAETPKSPIVIVFHGHGGTARHMYRKNFHPHWPEAFFVFPQGLPTKSYYDSEGTRTGWQNARSGDSDRDVKFFDAMLASLLEEGGDPNRVFVTGHSNGGGFTYELWALRHDRLAAIASSAGGGMRAADLQPLPAMHLAGRLDTLVSFTGQERTIDMIRRVNRCEDKPTKSLPNIGTEYPSRLGVPVVTYIHDGGHEFLDDAPQRIVGFFKLRARPENGYPKAEPIEVGGEGMSRFDDFDLNGDGVVTTEELKRPFLFRVMDSNSDAKITREEAAIYMRQK